LSIYAFWLLPVIMVVFRWYVPKLKSSKLENCHHVSIFFTRLQLLHKCSILYFMKTFKNYKSEDCILTDEQENHISQRHPDATLNLISSCLKTPNEVRRSTSNHISNLYYITKTESRLFCVVLKVCPDGNFISTAYSTTKIKSGQLIYEKEN
jgi:hypothetical protein